MVPTYVGYLSGATVTKTDRGLALSAPKAHVFYHALGFVTGFSVMFIAIGASVGLVGWVLRDNLSLLGKIGGSLMIVFGLHLSGILEIPAFLRERRLGYEATEAAGYSRSFLVGTAYVIGWTPCIGPTANGAIPTLAAASGVGPGHSASGGLFPRDGHTVPGDRAGVYGGPSLLLFRLGPYLGFVSLR